MRVLILSALAVFVSVLFAAKPADADGGFISEVRAGLYAHDIGDDFERIEDPVVGIAGELLFRGPDWQFENALVDFLFTPRPHVGAYVTTSEGTSFGYAGLTWDVTLFGPVFFEVGFGGAVQTGEVGTNDPKRRDLGSTLHFHQQVTLGIELTQHLRMLTTYQHISNANFASPNPGLNVAGVKLGYAF